LDLTQPIEPACRVKIISIYKHIVRLSSIRCKTFNKKIQNLSPQQIRPIIQQSHKKPKNTQLQNKKNAQINGNTKNLTTIDLICNQILGILL